METYRETYRGENGEHYKHTGIVKHIVNLPMNIRRLQLWDPPDGTVTGMIAELQLYTFEQPMG